MAESLERKISPRLRERLDTTRPGDEVDVVIELSPPEMPTSGTRADRMAAAKRDFDTEVDSVAGRLSSVGGKVLESAWVNSTVRGRLPAEAVDTLAEDNLVQGVDLPSAIEAESGSG